MMVKEGTVQLSQADPRKHSFLSGLGIGLLFPSLFASLAFVASAASGQDSNCAATALGLVGCGQGITPYVTELGDTLGSRDQGWYTSDPDPNDTAYGAYPYTTTLGRTTDANGKPYADTLGCSNLMGMTQNCN